ncbi:putative RNA-directed DNA polymerase, partial [Tanacetum coccineum]
MNMTLIFMAKTFKLNYNTPIKNNQRISPNPHNFQIAQLGVNMGQERHMQMVGGNGGRQKQGIQNVSNQNGLIVVPAIRNQNGNIVAAWIKQNGNGSNTNQIRCYNYRGVGHYARNCITRPKRRDYAYIQNQLLIAQIKEAGLQLNAEEYDLIIVFVDYEEEEKLHVNCILMANLQQASTSGTHADTALVYDSTKVHQNENCYNNEIFNMFAQEEQYTKLLESTTDTYLVQQSDSNVIPKDSNMDLSGGQVEQHPATIEKTHAFYESLYNNLVIEVEKINTINRETKEANETLTAELARYKAQEK